MEFFASIKGLTIAKLYCGTQLLGNSRSFLPAQLSLYHLIWTLGVAFMDLVDCVIDDYKVIRHVDFFERTDLELLEEWESRSYCPLWEYGIYIA